MGKYFTAEDIALIEHEVLAESNLLDMADSSINWMLYISGIHDLADIIIAKIKEKEGDA